jgi:hypothetical protein
LLAVSWNNQAAPALRLVKLLHRGRTFPQSLTSALSAKLRNSTTFHCTHTEPDACATTLKPAAFLEMGSNDKYEKHLPAFSPPVFHDPFASIEGGVGSLSIKSDANRTLVSPIATSTISVQCTNFDGENDSTDPSCITTTSPPYSISRDVSPTRHSPARNDEEGGTAPSMSLYSRGNEEFLFPSAELGFLDVDRPGSPSSCGSPNSFDPNVTPHPCSSIGDHDHGANFDGWADLPKSYGARLCKYFRLFPADLGH